MFDSFIFDLDGTLVDTIEDIKDSVNYSLKVFKLKTRTKEEILSYIGDGSILLIKRAMAFQNLELFEAVFSTYKKRYLNHYLDKSKAYDGIKEILIDAKKEGIKLFVFTNKPQDIADKIIEALFPDTFTKVIGMRKDSLVKPNPKRFVEGCKDILINFENSCYFGDSSIDIQTACNLKIPNVYAVLWGYTSKDKFIKEGYKPTDFLSEVKKLRQLF